MMQHATGAADVPEAHKFVVKRTFIDVVESPECPDEGFAGLRSRACSDPTLFVLGAQGMPQCSPAACGGGDSVDFELTGFSDTETLDGIEDAELPCYSRLPKAATPPTPTPAALTGPPAQTFSSEHLQGTDAESSAAGSEEGQVAAQMLAADNARLQMENQLLRERLLQEHQQMGRTTPCGGPAAVVQQQQEEQQQQWHGMVPWSGAMMHMPMGFVSIPICMAQVPNGEQDLGGGAPTGARQPKPQRSEPPRNSQKQRGQRVMQAPQASVAERAPLASPEHGAIKAEQEDSGPRTTVMLRNLPNNYTRAMLLGLLDSEGFAGQYDFLYLPIDFKTRACLGYAFINLVNADVVPRFWNTFAGYSNWILPSRKLCHISWSEPHQGLQAHLERYRNSPIMHASVPDEHKPVFLQDGVRTSFPEPTKATRAPRPRPSAAPKGPPERWHGGSAGAVGARAARGRR